MEKATIYDYARFTQVHCFADDECAGCPLHDFRCELENANSEELAKINEIILNWCKEHPIKTRQDEFLKMFPNAEKLSNNVVNVNPCQVDKKIFVGLTTIDCITSKGYNCCAQCKNEYWLAEVEE